MHVTAVGVNHHRGYQATPSSHSRLAVSTVKDRSRDVRQEVVLPG
jgi:hypothetical protein